MRGDLAFGLGLLSVRGGGRGGAVAGRGRGGFGSLGLGSGLFGAFAQMFGNLGHRCSPLLLFAL